MKPSAGRQGPKASPDDLARARELVRRAQWYWDFIAAENRWLS
jgi:formate-dependent nitrite reductase cytochrome c552 subunit